MFPGYLPIIYYGEGGRHRLNIGNLVTGCNRPWWIPQYRLHSICIVGCFWGKIKIGYQLTNGGDIEVEWIGEM